MNILNVVNLLVIALDHGHDFVTAAAWVRQLDNNIQIPEGSLEVAYYLAFKDTDASANIASVKGKRVYMLYQLQKSK